MSEASNFAQSAQDPHRGQVTAPTEPPHAGAAAEQVRAALAAGRRQFSYWNLAGADLSQAQLQDANFYGADLRNANLLGADLSRANLGRANLRGANLNTANVSEAFFEGADLTDAQMTDVVRDRPSPPAATVPASAQPAVAPTPPGNRAPNTTRFCIYCGTALPTGAVFCPACGQAQPAMPQAASPSVPLTSGQPVGPYNQPSAYASQPGRPYPPPPVGPYGPQPGYAQPPYAQAPYGQPPGQGHQAYPGSTLVLGVGANRWGPSSVRLDANLAAGLSYLIPIIGVIFFLMEKTNRFLKFHSAQAILVLNVLPVLWSIVWGVLAVISLLPVYLSAGATTPSDPNAQGAGLLIVATECGLDLLLFLGGVVIAVFWVWGMVAAFTGKYVKLPIVGGLADRWASKLPMPTV